MTERQPFNARSEAARVLRKHRDDSIPEVASMTGRTESEIRAVEDGDFSNKVASQAYLEYLLRDKEKPQWDEVITQAAQLLFSYGVPGHSASMAANRDNLLARLPPLHTIISTVRKAKGLSQEEAAERGGASRSTICRVEADKMEANNASLRNICTGLGMAPSVENQHSWLFDQYLKVINQPLLMPTSMRIPPMATIIINLCDQKAASKEGLVLPPGLNHEMIHNLNKQEYSLDISTMETISLALGKPESTENATAWLIKQYLGMNLSSQTGSGRQV